MKIKTIVLGLFVPGLGALERRNWRLTLLSLTAVIGAGLIFSIAAMFGPNGLIIGGIFFALVYVLQALFTAYGDYLTSSDSQPKVPHIAIRILYCCLAIYLALFIRQKIAPTENFHVPANSMFPTIKSGDHVIANKLAYWSAPVKRGDVIVFRFPKDQSVRFLKRVIAIVGDKIETIPDGRVRF